MGAGPVLPAGMSARPANPTDAEVVLGLLRDWDRAETGEVDTDLADVQQRLSVDSGDSSSAALLVESGGYLVAAAFLAGDEGEVYVRPRHPDGAAVEEELVRWLRLETDRTGHRLTLMVSVDAVERQARYAAAGLAYAHSILQYQRPLIELPEPVWPAGVSLQDWTPERDARHVHALIRTAFRDVRGQPDRDWPSWSAAFLTRPDTDVLTVRENGRLTGAAVLSSYDNYGHVRQLAVDQGSRGHGLGKALLLASFQRFAGRALPEARLGVYATNRTALSLYAGAGMTLLSESQVWTRPE